MVIDHGAQRFWGFARWEVCLSPDGEMWGLNEMVWKRKLLGESSRALTCPLVLGAGFITWKDVKACSFCLI